MHNSQQSNDERHLLLNLVLILLETVFSFILKNDHALQLQAKKFIQQRTRLKISSYLPYFQFYVEFSPQGLLFDRTAQNPAVDLDIGLSVIDIVKVFMLGHAASLQQIRIDGPAELSHDLRGLLLHFSAPRLIADWRQWLLPTDLKAPEDATSNQRRLAPFLDKIEQQRDDLRQLKMEIVQQKFRLEQTQARQRYMIILLSALSVLLLITLLYVTVVL